MNSLFSERPRLPEPFNSMDDASLCVSLTRVLTADFDDGRRSWCRVWHVPPGMTGADLEKSIGYLRGRFARIPACDINDAWDRLGVTDE